MLSAYWADPHQTEDQEWWITKKLDRFNHCFNHQASRYREVITWALDHRSAMVALAIGTFFASFTLFAGGVTGLLGAFAGIAVLVWALTSKRLSGLPRIVLAVAGLVLFYALPKVIAASGLAWR